MIPTGTIHGFPELTLGGVLVAPFVPIALVGLAVFLLLRPLLRRVPIDRIFANPPLVGVCLYIVIVAVLTIVF